MKQPKSFYRPWVDCTARYIPDPLWRLRYLQSVAPPPAPPPHRVPKVLAISVVCALLLGAAPLRPRIPPPLPTRRLPLPSPTPAANQALLPAVWIVEGGSDFDLYSNGLRIENRYATTNRPRSYRAFPLHDDAASGELRMEPAGIVYHTTESLQAPFDASQNNVLKRVSESLADYVQRRRAYNFLIDRFGRVYRIVREEDAANHAGHSIWADDSSVYIGLNDSFLGISFEAKTAGLPGPEKVNPAQIRSGAMLTELLRYRYRIPPQDCVTHAQVSVNPSNFQIGYHTDWGSRFPFQELGLPDNYVLPIPALTIFGFSFDSAFVQRAGDRLSATAEQSLAPHREALRRRYLRIARSLHQTPSAAE